MAMVLCSSSEYDYSFDDIREYLSSPVAMRTPAGFVLLWMTSILFCLYSNHCCATTKPPMLKTFLRRKTCCGQLPNNPVAEQLAELLKKRSRSLTHLDTQDLLELRSNNHSDFNYSDSRSYHHSDINETKQCNESTPKSRRSSRETEEAPHRVPKKRCSSGDSRHSVGGHSISGHSVGGDSSHRYSEASSYSDSDSLRRRYFGWSRRFSNYSVATTVHTTLSSFIEPETALDLAENLMVELFDTDDIDGIIPARFLHANQDAIVDNIREEEYTPSYSPTASCDQSSFDDDFLPHSYAGESTSEMRFSSMSSPHNTGSPRSSRHSKSSSPERLEPLSSYPIEGGMPRASIWSMTNMQLDTVEEETASQMSPSPRVMSPRISIDNGESFDAVADLQSKPSQPTAHRLSVPYMRKISLQRDHQREHHRFSVESMPISENSFYFSVTSFDDDIVGKMEMLDDQIPSPMPSPKLDRRQRKVGTVSTPNSVVLQWLATMPKEPQQRLDPDAPWPFNEDVATSTTTSEVVMETLTVPERRISLSETSDLDSFHSCRDDYAASNISGQDSFDCTQLDVNHNDQITDQGDDQDKDDTLRREVTLDQQPAHRRQRLKQQREAIDFDY